MPLKNFQINKLAICSSLAIFFISFFIAPSSLYAVMVSKAPVVKNVGDSTAKFDSIIVKYKNKDSSTHLDYTTKKINEVHSTSSTPDISSTPIELQHVQTLSNGSKVLKIKNYGALLRKIKNAITAINRMRALAGQPPMAHPSMNQPENQLGDDLKRTLLQFKNDSNVEYAEPNYILRMAKVPAATVTRYKEQWSYFDEKAGINLPKAWDVTTGSDVVVAVLDSGIVKHEALKDKILPGRNFVTATLIDGESIPDANLLTDPTDRGDGTEYHGTHVAGTIGAIGNVITGVSWGSKILPVRVIGANGIGQVSSIAEGLLWAVGLGDTKPYPDKKAKILNLSLGEMAECGQTMQSAIDKAVESGAIVVVAAGNNSLPAKGFMPANCNNVISVGATDSLGLRGYYSNYNVEADKDTTIKVLAPGGGNGFLDPKDGVLSLGAAPDTYQYLSGTSMAAPHVSGVIALMLSVNADLKLKEILEYLQKSARGDVMSLGIIDASKALSLIPKQTAAVVTPAPAINTTPLTTSWKPDYYGAGSFVACYIKNKKNSSTTGWSMELRDDRRKSGNDCVKQMANCELLKKQIGSPTSDYCCIHLNSNISIVDVEAGSKKCLTQQDVVASQAMAKNKPEAQPAYGTGSLTACYIKKTKNSGWDLALKNSRTDKGDCNKQMSVCSQISNICKGEEYCCMQQDTDAKVLDFDRNTRKCITK